MVEILVDQRAQTGEGPAWDAKVQHLYWLDIPQSTIFRYNPADGSNQSLDLSQQFESIGTLAPRQKGGLLIAPERKIGFLDWETGQVEIVLEVEPDLPDNRFNDGKCDPRGRMLIGSMSNHQDGQPHGSLYCIDTDLTLRKLRDGLFVSNGMGWSPDYRQFYLVDSRSRDIWVYDYDLETGSIQNQRVAFRLPEGHFVGDGMTVDQQGMIWLALWDGARITRWDPYAGRLLEEHSFPAKRTSSCVFGGKDMDELYVTSATKGISEPDWQLYPYNGALMRQRLAIRGMPTFAFGS